MGIGLTRLTASLILKPYALGPTLVLPIIAQLEACPAMWVYPSSACRFAGTSLIHPEALKSPSIPIWLFSVAVAKLLAPSALPKNKVLLAGAS